MKNKNKKILDRQEAIELMQRIINGEGVLSSHIREQNNKLDRIVTRPTVCVPEDRFPRP